MSKYIQQVSDFNYLFNIIQNQYTGEGEVNTKYFDITHASFNESQFRLRLSLINEEVNEFVSAKIDGDIVEMIDAICDIIYVVYGAVVYFNFTNNLFKNIKIEKNDDAIDCNTINANIAKSTSFDTLTYLMQSKIESLKRVEGLMLNGSDMLDYLISIYEALLIDIATIVYALSDIMRINFDAFFTIVHSSNMTKFCTSHEQAMRTVENYKLTQTTYKNPQYRQTTSDGNIYYVIYDGDTNKILKSIDYKKVDFGDLLTL